MSRGYPGGLPFVLRTPAPCFLAVLGQSSFLFHIPSWSEAFRHYPRSWGVCWLNWNLSNPGPKKIFPLYVDLLRHFVTAIEGQPTQQIKIFPSSACCGRSHISYLSRNSEDFVPTMFLPLESTYSRWATSNQLKIWRANKIEFLWAREKF